MVELMDGKMLSGPEEHTVLFGPQLGIAEPDEPPGVLRRPRQDPGQLCPAVSVSRCPR